ncbi:MAG: hypothetical protein KGM43_10540 [Planctomycetota bacterium]|nr:hypothetical protein [Planctomycetota bacterium]
MPESAAQSKKKDTLRRASRRLESPSARIKPTRDTTARTLAFPYQGYPTPQPLDYPVRVSNPNPHVVKSALAPPAAEQTGSIRRMTLC